MTRAEKIELIAETISVEPENIFEDRLLSDIDEYDSMTKLSVIVLFVDRFNKKLNINDVNSLKSIKDIMALMD